MVTYCTAAQVADAMGLAWAEEDTLGSNTLNTSIFVNASVGRKYSVGDTIRLYNDVGSTEDSTVTGVSYGTTYITLTVGSLTSESAFTTGKNSTVQIKSYYTGLTNPTKSTVETFIENAESEIEDYTRMAWGSQGTFSGRIRWDPRKTFILGEPYSWYKVLLPYPDPVTPLASASGDSLKVWNGSTETERLGTWTEGRTSDFWLDGKQYLYINSVRPWPGNNTVNITYRYGATSVPNSIRRACILLTKCQILEANMYNNDALTESAQGEQYPYNQSTISLRNQAYTLLKKHRRLIFD